MEMETETETETMAGDEAIVKRMREILESADLSVVTTKDIRLQLEKDLGLDMSDKKVFIREQIDLFMQSHRPPEEAEEQGGEVGESASESDESESKAEDQEEPDSKRLQAKIKRAMKESLPKDNKRKRGGGSGFQKVCQLSPELAAVIGESQVPRTQVVKILWQYIRDHKLQVPKDRRKIQCDEALKKVFNVDQVDMFKMQKKLSKHLFPLDEASYLNAPERSKVADAKPEVGVEDVTREGGSRASRRIKRNQRMAERAREDSKLAKKIDKRRTGFAAPIRISPQLQRFLHVEESEISRQDVTKRMWEYIKTNELQDPDDKRIILCDEKLHKLFGCEKFSGFGDLPRLLKAHYLGKQGEKDEEAGSGEEEEGGKQDNETEVSESKPVEGKEEESKEVEGSEEEDNGEEEKQDHDMEVSENEPETVQSEGRTGDGGSN